MLYGTDSISGGSYAFTDENVGSGDKTVTVSGVTVNDGNSGGNYAVSYANNTTSTINKATLTVKADDQTKIRNAPNPSFTQTISGFVNGENALTAGLTGSAIGHSDATAASPAGLYSIFGSTGTLAARNYAFLAANGILTITKPPALSVPQESAMQAAQILPPTSVPPPAISGGLEFVEVTSGGTVAPTTPLPEGGTQSLAGLVRVLVEDGGILLSERTARQ